MTARPSNSHAPASHLPLPGLWRRLASALYECTLLFGVVFFAGYLYAGITQQRHALQGQLGLQIWLLSVLALYFVGFWTHGGQTVAMKAWHLRVVRLDGQPLHRAQAMARFALSWLWVLPALISLGMTPHRSAGLMAAVLAANVGAYALLARLHPSRQFLHDVLARTQIVTALPPQRR